MFKLLYAAPAWWGFANTSDRDRLEAFLRRAGKSGYQVGLPAVAELCEQTDDKLFRANYIQSYSPPPSVTNT